MLGVDPTGGRGEWSIFWIETSVAGGCWWFGSGLRPQTSRWFWDYGLVFGPRPPITTRTLGSTVRPKGRRSGREVSGETALWDSARMP
jgi:hypothetical protein